MKQLISKERMEYLFAIANTFKNKGFRKQLREYLSSENAFTDIRNQLRPMLIHGVLICYSNVSCILRNVYEFDLLNLLLDNEIYD